MSTVSGRKLHFYEWWPILLLVPWSYCRDAMPECLKNQQEDPFRAWGWFFFYSLSLWLQDLSSSIVYIHCQSGSTEDMVSPVLHSEMSSILGSSNMAPAINKKKLTTSVLSQRMIRVAGFWDAKKVHGATVGFDNTCDWIIVLNYFEILLRFLLRKFG